MAEWFYATAGGKVGPVDTAELKRLAGEGALQPTTFVWRDGLAEWVTASTVAGLFVSDVPAPVDSLGFSEVPALSAPVVSYQTPPSKRHPQNRSRQGRSSFGDFIQFRTMITVQIVVAVFVAGCLTLLAYTAYAVANVGWSRLEPPEAMLAVAGLLAGMLVGLLAWRLFCEFIVVVFRINESLTEFKNQERARAPANSSR